MEKEVIKFWNKFETFEQAWKACERGDWMLWVVERLGGIHNLDLICTKGHCTKHIKDLMKDQISKDAVDFAIVYRDLVDTSKLLGLASMAKEASLLTTERARRGTGSTSEANASYAAYFCVSNRTPLYEIATTVAGAIFEHQIEKGWIKRKDDNLISYYSSLKQTAVECRGYLTESVLKRVKDLEPLIFKKEVEINV